MKSTLLLKKQKKYHRLPLRLFVSGIKKVKSVLLELNPTYEDTILRIYKTLLVAVLILKRKKKSVTVVFLPENKWMTLNDKKIFLDTDSLITSWLQMSVRGLIGKEKVLEPFWAKQCTGISLRDRLCRFAFELLEWIFKRNGVRLVVLDEEKDHSSDQELTDDILSIIHVYSCRKMGKRRYKNKNPENSSLPNS